MKKIKIKDIFCHQLLNDQHYAMMFIEYQYLYIIFFLWIEDKMAWRILTTKSKVL